jgi:hypothetical protein
MRGRASEENDGEGEREVVRKWMERNKGEVVRRTIERKEGERQ